MSSLPEPPIFILEGHDAAIFESVEQAQSHLEPIDVKHGVNDAYDGQGRRLRISTDGRDIVIELAEEEPSDFSSLEAELRAHLVRRGEKVAAEAECHLPCLVDMSWRHAEFDRRSLAKVAKELEERHRAAFEERGGHLSVSAGKASNIRTRTKSMELYAGVEWDASRTYDHVHAEVARRPWFSWRWTRVQSLRETVNQIETKVTEWLSKQS